MSAALPTPQASSSPNTASHAAYSLRAFKSHRGSDGEAWAGTIYRGELKVGQASNDGRGGCDDFHFSDRNERELFEAAVEEWGKAEDPEYGSKYHEADGAFAMELLSRIDRVKFGKSMEKKYGSIAKLRLLDITWSISDQYGYDLPDVRQGAVPVGREEEILSKKPFVSARFYDPANGVLLEAYTGPHLPGPVPSKAGKEEASVQKAYEQRLEEIRTNEDAASKPAEEAYREAERAAFARKQAAIEPIRAEADSARKAAEKARDDALAALRAKGIQLKADGNAPPAAPPPAAAPPAKPAPKPVLNKKLESLLHMAVKTAGSIKPEECLGMIEEQLTLPEANAAEAFLRWCVAKGKTFGWNLPVVWREWRLDPTAPAVEA